MYMCNTECESKMQIKKSHNGGMYRKGGLKKKKIPDSSEAKKKIPDSPEKGKKCN